MTPFIDPNICIPYQIGCYILSVVQGGDPSNGRNEPCTERDKFFARGPNARCDQLWRGMILEVACANSQPLALYTRYGRWTVLDETRDDFGPIFRTITQTLHVIPFPSERNDVSLWRIHKWEGKKFNHPARAHRHDFVAEHRVIQLYSEFQEAMNLCYPKPAPQIAFESKKPVASANLANRPDSQTLASLVASPSLLAQAPIERHLAEAWKAPGSQPESSNRGWDPLFYAYPGSSDRL